MKVNKMLKTLKFLLLLTTISCGYTSNSNNVMNLIDTTDNNIIINNNLNNIINKHEDNNKILNTNKYIGKKRLSKKITKKENNAYKYLFCRDVKSKYFKDEFRFRRVSNPKYTMFMKGIYNIFECCLSTLIGRNPEVNLYDNDNIQLLEQIKFPVKKLLPFAQVCDTFKFNDKQNYKLDNNNVSNLNKYIEKYKNTLGDTVSFHVAYKYYLYNHIVKLYQQTVNALVKSINNREKCSNQVEIVNEFGQVVEKALCEFSNIINEMLAQEQEDIDNEQEYTNEDTLSEDQTAQLNNDGATENIVVFVPERNTSEEEQSNNSVIILNYNNSVQSDDSLELLEGIEESISLYCIPNLKKKIKEYNYNSSGLQQEFDEIHSNDIINNLNQVINSNKEYNILINNTDYHKISGSNKEYINKLLSGLNIKNKSDIKQCIKFFVNGKSMEIKEYLKELVKQLDVLKNITDQKIKYQIKNEHKFTFYTSIRYYIEIIDNVLEHIIEECHKQKHHAEQEVCNEIEDIKFSLFWGVPCNFTISSLD